MIDEKTLDAVITLCQQAGDAILSIYNDCENIHIERKADDSPLTQADLAAHQILDAGLSSLLDGLPVLSEEGEQSDYRERSQWHRYWLIDPLDGTKEFIQRNGEFTVNVALIEAGETVFGVVHIPVQSITYAGIKGQGAYKYQCGARQSIHTRPNFQRIAQQQSIEVLTSRRHGVEALAPLLQHLGQELGPTNTQHVGSSLKFCMIAEGAADIYPRLAPTCEWDTAAAQAIVEAAGGAVVSFNQDMTQLSQLLYNQKDSLLNPFFYVVGDPQLNWVKLLKT